MALNQNINEGLLKKWITYSILICRVTFVISLFFISTTPHITVDQFYRILYAILPCTILYVVFTIKYVVINKRYFHPGKPVSQSYFVLSCMPLIILHIIELLLIIFKRYIFDDIDVLYMYITLFECALAAYAGLYLSSLFTVKTVDEQY